MLIVRQARYNISTESVRVTEVDESLKREVKEPHVYPHSIIVIRAWPNPREAGFT